MPATDSSTFSRLLARAIAHHQRGELSEAEVIYRQILTQDERHADALHLLGLIAHQRGQNTQAEKLLRQALNVSSAPVAAHYNSLGLVQQAQGNFSAALVSFETAHKLDPDVAELASNLANALRLAGRPREAESLCRETISLHPGSSELHVVLGMTLRQQGQLVDARKVLQEAIVLNPNSADAHNGIGLVYRDLGQSTQAQTHFKRATELRPQFAEAFNNLGISLSELGQLTNAENNFRQALALQPNQATTYSNLGNTLQELSRTKEAIDTYSQAYRLGGGSGARIRSITALPVILDSIEEIHYYRKRIEHGLDELLNEPIQIDDPLKEIGRANFYLSYHGLNNRTLQSKLAQLYLRACPTLSWTARHCTHPRRHEDRLRIGFISKFMHNHSIGKTTSGLIANLSRERFEVHAIFVPPVVVDQTSTFIREKADRVVELPATLEAARQRIADLELDILFYQDIGMEPFTYFLAFSRLAPIQCTTFGHPDTTGVPTIDYWISCKLFEPEDARDHYSETLHLLGNAAHFAYYYRPNTTNLNKRHADFGLPADTHIYLCPQTLYKFHPDFDTMLAGILRADAQAQIVLIQGKTKEWAQLLRARIKKRFPDVVDRIMFLPGQSGPDFVNLIALSDVMLDTPHFNGYNTNLEAFAVGTPVVTLPKALQRGRHTAGMYKRMGISDCTASSEKDYIRIATKLGGDRDFRQHIRKLILERSDVMYEDSNIVREFERFFIDAAAQICPIK